MRLTKINNDEFEKLFDLSPNLFLVCDFEGIIRYINPASQTALKWNSREPNAAQLVEVVHPEDLGLIKSMIQSLTLKEELISFKCRYRTSSGAYRWLLCRASSNLSGRLIYASATHIETQTQTQLEENNSHMRKAWSLEIEAREHAERETERLRELLFQVPAIAAIVMGPDHVFEIVNPAYLDLVGSRNIIGKPVKEALPDIDTAVIQVLDQVYATGEAFSARRYGVKADWAADGTISQRFFDLVYEPIRDLSGNPIGVWALAFDVTEMMKMEEQLRLSERMASLGQLAASIGHEINNPLTYVMTNIELLKENLSSPEDLDRVDKVVQGLNRVRRVMDGLHGFARGDQKREPLDVSEVVRAAVEMTSNEVRHRAQLIEKYHDVPQVKASHQELSQVFINLLMNAAQAFQGKDIEKNLIELSTCKLTGDEVAIEVRDTGCGIERAQMKRIFDPFYTSKPAGVGTGLGLAISQKIVMSFGGRIEVTSDVGVGTCVRVVLPALLGREEVKLNTKRASCADSAKNESLRILIVDDEDLVRDVMKQILSGEHYVDSVATIDEALRLVGNDEKSYDVIFCDVLLPNKSGKDFYEILKMSECRIYEQIIFMSGGTFDPKLNQWLETLSNVRLEKPFSLERLREVVNQAHLMSH